MKVVAYDAATAEVNAFKNGTYKPLSPRPKQEGDGCGLNPNQT